LFTHPQIILFIIVLFILVTLLSGLYPALVLSRFKPSVILKSRTPSSKQSVSLRKYLTVFQFVIAQVFILGTLLVGKQIHFLMNKDVGFKTDAIVYLSSPWNDNSKQKRRQFVDALRNIPLVQDVSLAGNPPASDNVSSDNLTYRDGEKEIQQEVEFLYGDLNYLKLYNIELLAGRERLNDSIREYIINESYLKILGFKSPQDAIGKFLYGGNEKTQIVGVMKNFNQHSLKLPILPLILTGDVYGSEYPLLSTIHFSLVGEEKNDWEAGLSKIETTYKSIYPDATYQLHFIDEIIARFYVEEQKISTLLNWAMWLSIVISCLGLLGLVIHTTQTRTKEIGIRKVLGQKSIEVTLLLSKEFMKLVAISIVIGIPIAYILFKDWLSGFSYQTPLNITYFILAAGLTFLIALITISSQTILASKRNPAETLKEE